MQVNKNLWRAAEEFGLELSDFDGKEDILGIWDGSEFLLTVSLPRRLYILVHSAVDRPK